ncbi:hypothetical protein BCV70DRAFT_84692 [Testicularia cyperi]|uniref:Uncharacterized protein n=1 Tax=Testicularia cyperi TaxID=1882483 RepID=A0A317XRN9_9BASI|nr:hypothetical protein BCV70DRAFT_84692 [Testicularia cyperi]
MRRPLCADPTPPLSNVQLSRKQQHSSHHSGLCSCSRDSSRHDLLAPKSSAGLIPYQSRPRSALFAPSAIMHCSCRGLVAWAVSLRSPQHGSCRAPQVSRKCVDSGSLALDWRRLSATPGKKHRQQEPPCRPVILLRALLLWSEIHRFRMFPHDHSVSNVADCSLAIP